MAYALLKRTYEAAPGWAKSLVGSVPFGVLAGRSYRATLRRGSVLDRAGPAEIARYQQAALQRILEFACDQVPAYAGLRATVARLPAREALKAFPLLDKEALQADLPRYLPRDFARIPHYECSTGGTSGNQLKLFLDDNSQSVEMAFMHRMWARVGYAPRHRKATFRGVEFRGLRAGRYWQANPVYNEVQFSPFTMNEATLGAYCDELLRFRPHYLHGYPSALAILADYITRRGVSVEALPLRAALLCSEPIFPEQRELIERAFRTRAFSWYGHSERLLLAGECEAGASYHHFPDYGVLELVAGDGALIDREGERGELVGTGLLNRSMPLIRYRTGDVARKLEARCTCGRTFDRFDEVEGWRKQEFLVGKNGSLISLAALNMHGPLFERVVRYQYYQETPGRMLLRLMVADGFSVEDTAALRRGFAVKVGDELAVEIQIVPEIPLTARGKLRRLIQEIPAPSSTRATPRGDRAEGVSGGCQALT